METRLLGMGELAASGSPQGVFMAVALGSCIAVVAHDPVARVTGMAHVALPGTARGVHRKRTVGYYADTAVPALLRAMEETIGARCGAGLSIKLFGGASMVDGMSHMAIGRRNVLAVRRALYEVGFEPAVEHVGGTWSRTIRVRVLDARVTVRTPGWPDRSA